MNLKTTGTSIMLFLLLSCSRDSCPLGSGNTTQEIRDLPSFHNIILYDKINVILTPDTVQTVRVEAGRNLLSGISTSVFSDTLSIQDNNGCKMLRTGAEIINVFISTGQLQKIVYYGSGNVSTTDTIRAPLFTVDCISGSGSINLQLISDSVKAIVRTKNANISLSGYGTYAYIYCEDVGSVDLFQFITRAIDIESKSIRDIDVYSTESLFANILYKGNVYYMGNPPLIKTFTNNSGKLIHVP